jgi:Family of unknown function (DUF6295)
MCTTISAKLAMTGSGKGADGWFALDHAYVGYDHPTHAPVEHAVLLDFVNEATGPGARVAVELSLESARTLVRQLTETLAEADAYEA